MYNEGEIAEDQKDVLLEEHTVSIVLGDRKLMDVQEI